MTTAEPRIVVDRVCFGYNGRDVVHDLSLDLRRGEVVAIAGPNGSGKSTLLELMAGVLRPRRGSISREGALALVVQRADAPTALPVTAADVVAMGMWRRGLRPSRTDMREAVAVALARVGLADLADRPLAGLSGGQRQRAFVGQGIVSSPDVLLLDEPAAGLDRDSIARTQRIMREEADRGATVACVTHHESDAAAADRVIRLEQGHLEAA